jgi:molybdopterin-containing oxidoreductase family iron-sulfur binding subunit
MTDNNSMIDYNKIRQSIAAGSGPDYWRSLDELANSPEFQAKMKQEFPSQESRWVDPVTRRSFLKVMGASLALTGLAGCTGFSKPREHILPYTNQPENMVPGKALFFASAMPYLGLWLPGSCREPRRSPHQD